MSDGTSSKSPPRERRMLDRYELIAEIARGGMGTVMLARVEGAGGFQRFFAIKVMHAHLAEDRQFVHMLLDEARLAARIHHPNVVATVDVCESKIGYYLVMDWVEGFTFEQIMEHPHLDPISRIRVANRILLDSMAGLDAAHNLPGDDGQPLGIVHRDVSPQNILVGLDGVARITDFGVALAASRITSSRPGIIKGKPAYMAPEQARGENLDRRADVFALGVMLWESLTGQRLFMADSDAGTVYRVIHAPITRPRELMSEVPEALQNACLRALERDTSLRTPSARAMATEILRAAEPAGLICSSNEVAETIASLFGLEITERRAAIRDHLSRLGTASAPIVASDVFDIPKLRQRTTSPGTGPAGGIPDDPAYAATKTAHTPEPSGTPSPRMSREAVPGTRSGQLEHATVSLKTPRPAARPGTTPSAHAAPSVAGSGTPRGVTGAAAGSSGAHASSHDGFEGSGNMPPPTGGGVSRRTLIVWALCVLLAITGTVWLVARLAGQGGATIHEPTGLGHGTPPADPGRLAVEPPPTHSTATSTTTTTTTTTPPGIGTTTPPGTPTTTPTTTTPPTTTPPGPPPTTTTTSTTPTGTRPTRPTTPGRRHREPGEDSSIEVEANPYR